MSPAPATVTSLRDYVRSHAPTDEKLVRIADEATAANVLGRDNAARITAVVEEQGDQAAVLQRIESAIGTSPDPSALSHASQTDLSPEAIRQAALGTGLHRRVSEVQVQVGSLDRKLAAAGFGVAAASTILPAIFAALPGTAQVASGVVLALVAALGGIWAARPKKLPALPPKEG